MVNPHFPLAELFGTSTPIRLVTYTTMGVLVGWFAHSNRALVGQLQAAEENDFLTGLLNTRSFDDGDSSLLLFRAADERLYAQKLIRSRLAAAEIVDLPSRPERLRQRGRTG